MGSSRFASSRARISTILMGIAATALIGCSGPVPSDDTETVGKPIEKIAKPVKSALDKIGEELGKWIEGLDRRPS